MIKITDLRYSNLNEFEIELYFTFYYENIGALHQKINGSMHIYKHHHLF